MKSDACLRIIVFLFIGVTGALGGCDDKGAGDNFCCLGTFIGFGVAAPLPFAFPTRSDEGIGNTSIPSSESLSSRRRSAALIACSAFALSTSSTTAGLFTISAIESDDSVFRIGVDNMDVEDSGDRECSCEVDLGPRGFARFSVGMGDEKVIRLIEPSESLSSGTGIPEASNSDWSSDAKSSLMDGLGSGTAAPRAVPFGIRRGGDNDMSRRAAGGDAGRAVLTARRNPDEG